MCSTFKEELVSHGLPPGGFWSLILQPPILESQKKKESTLNKVINYKNIF